MKKEIELLLNWYDCNQRKLPWREDKDPYHVWISEIMLQQTRIEAVISYYLRFIKEVPTIQELSMISEDRLLKLWEGLGYYSRARNLKKAAIQIMDKFHGDFPNNYSDILSLSGIGEYTAGAISSICFNLPEVAIDGNVMRVYVRLFDLDLDVSDLKVKKEIGHSIRQILPENSGDFNQALMELGEVLCLPNGFPKCFECPLQYFCRAHLNHRETLIPRKVKKKEKLEEEYTLFLLICNGKVAIHRRSSGLLKNMWEFPNVSGFLSFDEVRDYIPSIIHIELGITSTHIFTHKKWFMNSYFIEIKEEIPDYQWVDILDVQEHYALPTAFAPFYSYIKEKYPN